MRLPISTVLGVVHFSLTALIGPGLSTFWRMKIVLLSVPQYWGHPTVSPAFVRLQRLKNTEEKGGQNVLIKARLNRAAELGCQVACSQTLTMLKTSLGNLESNGFEIIYEKQVFIWES